MTKRLLNIGICFLLLTPTCPDAADHDPAAAWELVRWFEFNEANTAFDELAEDAAEATSPILFGKAVTLLNRQPKTAANLAQARDYLERLVSQNSNNEWGLRARYFLARICQIHDRNRDVARAKGIYEELFAERGETHVGQLAALNWATLHLYTTDGSIPFEVRIAEVENLVPSLSDRWVRKDLHLLLGRAYLFFDLSEERSLQHYLDAAKVGIVATGYRGSVYVTIGSLAERQGKPGVALDYYQRFVREYPRDNRTYTIRQRINGILSSQP